MGNVLDSECIEKGGFCSCLRGDEREDRGMELSAGEGGVDYQQASETSKTASNPRRSNSSSSNKASSKGKSAASKGTKTVSKGGPSKEAAAAPPPTAAAAASQPDNAPKKTTIATAAPAEVSPAPAATKPPTVSVTAPPDSTPQTAPPAAAAAKTTEAPAAKKAAAATATETAAAKKAAAAAAEDARFFVINSRSPPVEEETLHRILKAPLRAQSLLLQSLFKQWAANETTLSLDNLSQASAFLTTHTECRGPQEAEEHLVCALGSDSTLTCEAFITLVEKLGAEERLASEAFMGLQPQEGPQGALVAELPDARAALRQLCESSLEGEWLGEETIERMLDILVKDAQYLLPLSDFLGIAETLAIATRCLNLLYKRIQR